MKRYKVVRPYRHNTEATDLRELETGKIIMADPDGFRPGEIVNSNQIAFRCVSYVDDQGTGSARFAFRRLPFVKNPQYV